ncbi:MAG: hypothetical protein ACW99U_19220 [Candidatus Thorarchaeota archaeon]|jgi:hypothetical protein
MTRGEAIVELCNWVTTILDIRDSGALEDFIVNSSDRAEACIKAIQTHRESQAQEFLDMIIRMARATAYSHENNNEHDEAAVFYKIVRSLES